MSLLCAVALGQVKAAEMTSSDRENLILRLESNKNSVDINHSAFQALAISHEIPNSINDVLQQFDEQQYYDIRLKIARTAAYLKIDMDSITELEPSPRIDIVDFEEPQTPAMTALNVAEVHDWQSRIKDTESELATERKRLYYERKRTRRLQNEVNTYHNSLTISKRVSDEAIIQCQSLLHMNALLAQEVQRQKIAVETLEALIQKLYTQHKEGSVFTQVPVCQAAGTVLLSAGMEGIVEED